MGTGVFYEKASYTEERQRPTESGTFRAFQRPGTFVPQHGTFVPSCRNIPKDKAT